MKLIHKTPVCLALLSQLCFTTFAQDWRAALQEEKAKNADRISAIQEQGEPIAAQLRQVNAAIERHNANRCTAPEDQPSVCASYEREAQTLNTSQERLRSRLIPLVQELDQLRARNAEIDQKLKRCVQTTHPCSSDNDCECSHACATFDGRGNSGVCQPSS